ncbi:MAG: class I SAM-dependent methyltransferase [Deltaproteobacteria bacterium]|nr:MAG: class I SAM-dependent methyltransferase [Deltaproteobacteria bacterium]
MPIQPDQHNPNREIYNTAYSGGEMSLFTAGMLPYDREMIRLRLELLRRYGAGKEVLDLCCGTGSYLRQEWVQFQRAVGVDFSRKMLEVFKRELGGEMPSNLLLLEGDARRVPVRSGSMDLVFSFTSLYYVPQVSLAVAEISRVLKPGGVAVFELGNLWSLNTYVSARAYRRQGIAKPFHVSLAAMLGMIREANLEIMEHRSFQFLPMWGGGPCWLRPLTDWRWKWLLGLKARGRMLDERLSSIRPLKYLAFRHLFVCKKRNANNINL